MTNNPWIKACDLNPKEGEVYEGEFGAKRYASYSPKYGKVVLYNHKLYGAVVNELKTNGECLYKLISPVIEYEDKWHINDGSPIPEDADTLEKDGSVVAYRLIKEEPIKVGDWVTWGSGSENYKVEHLFKMRTSIFALVLTKDKHSVIRFESLVKVKRGD